MQLMNKLIVAFACLAVACSSQPGSSGDPDSSPPPAPTHGGPDTACECGQDRVPACFAAGVFQGDPDPDLCAFPCPGPTESAKFKCGSLPDGTRCCVMANN